MRTSFWLGAALLVSCGFGDNGHHHTTTTCGDGVTDSSEGCDDGNEVSGDGCSEACSVESANPVCGNGTREAGEGCDDGNTTSGDGCSAMCEAQSLCGNGQVDADEACDDGNTASGDGCSPTCQAEQTTACSLLPQGGCGGGTPACDFTPAEDGTTECRVVSAAGTSDSRCSSLTACSAGWTCAGVEIGVDSSCMRFCASDSGCSGAGARCAFTLVNNSGTSLNVKVCSNACDPYLQVGCPSGMGCNVYDSNGGDFTDCRVMGSKSVGASCASNSECSPGALCVDDGSPHCRYYCKLGQSGTCPSPQTCNAFSATLAIGSTSYGYCH